MAKDSWTMTTDISLLFKKFKLFQEEMIVNSSLFGNTGCPPIRFPRLQRSIVFPVLNGYRFETRIEACKEKPAKKQNQTLHLISQFPLALPVTDPASIHQIASAVPSSNHFERKLVCIYYIKPCGFFYFSIFHPIAEICSSSYVLQQLHLHSIK